MKSIWQLWWLLALSTLGAAVVGAALLRGVLVLGDTGGFGILVFLGVVAVIACFLAIVASAVITEILVYWRFYKNLFTDEGYLTFTLPVSRRTLLLSKTVNAMIWNAAQVVLILVSVVLILLIGIPNGEGLAAIRGVLLIGSLLWAEIGAWSLVYALEIVVLALFGMLFSVSLIHFCITMGAMLAKKYKLLAAIGVYYVVNMVVSLASQIVALVLALLMGDGLMRIMMVASGAMQGGIIALMLLISCAMMAALACTVYFFMQTKLERNLNLA